MQFQADIINCYVLRNENPDLLALGAEYLAGLAIKFWSSENEIKKQNKRLSKSIDEELILKTAKKTGLIVTMEEHSIINGLGSAVADVLALNYPIKIIKFGFNDEWPVNGPVWSEVMDYH